MISTSQSSAVRLPQTTASASTALLLCGCLEYSSPAPEMYINVAFLANLGGPGAATAVGLGLRDQHQPSGRPVLDAALRLPGRPNGNLCAELAFSGCSAPGQRAPGRFGPGEGSMENIGAPETESKIKFDIKIFDISNISI